MLEYNDNPKFIDLIWGDVRTKFNDNQAGKRMYR